MDTWEVLSILEMAMVVKVSSLVSVHIFLLYLAGNVKYVLYTIMHLSLGQTLPSYYSHFSNLRWMPNLVAMVSAPPWANRKRCFLSSTFLQFSICFRMSFHPQQLFIYLDWSWWRSWIFEAIFCAQHFYRYFLPECREGVHIAPDGGWLISHDFVQQGD